MKVIVLFAAITVMLSGCISHNVQRYAEIDATQKTVTVPPGSKGLKGELKKVLLEMGWRLSVDRGPSVVEGDFGETTKLESYDTFNTRYRLHVASSRVDFCFNFQPLVVYDISFIDNKTGGEVFTIEGRGCEGGAVDKFGEALSSVAR
ncbi:MAG: hypothetical protein K0U79_09640 [Gammaproteobacteria bacterium]|nr:hypothetical protein [Gammaproteobacteria bacterium]